MVTLGKSWHLFVSKSSALHLSSQRVIDTFSRRSCSLSQLGAGVYSVGVYPVPHARTTPGSFKNSASMKCPLSCFQFVSEPNTWFRVFHHSSYSNILLCNSHTCMDALLSPRASPPETFNFTSLQPSVHLETHCTVSSSGTSPSSAGPDLIFEPS